MRRALLASLPLLISSFAACGGADDAPGTTQGAAGTGGSGAATKSFVCPAGMTVSPGKTEGVKLADRTRAFTIDVPAQASGPLPVVWQWHGFGDTPESFSAALGLAPDKDASFPFVRVVPDDLSLLPVQGLDWALFDTGQDGDPNPDLALFEAINGCLVDQGLVDPDRVYVVGFSAGAIMANLIHSKYPKDIAATVSYSGAWFSDAMETAGVDTLGYPVVYAWPPLDVPAAGPILLTHGGKNDNFFFNGKKVIDFEVSSASALPFLAAAGRTVVACAHTHGHTPPPELGAQAVLDFLKAHVRGKPSAWGGALPAGFPAICSM